jgi:hypothetical protein
MMDWRIVSGCGVGVVGTAAVLSYFSGVPQWVTIVGVAVAAVVAVAIQRVEGSGD